MQRVQRYGQRQQGGRYGRGARGRARGRQGGRERHFSSTSKDYSSPAPDQVSRAADERHQYTADLNAHADEERRLAADEIHEILANGRVSGKGFVQTFGDPRGHDDASTTYWEGNNSSFGRWKVEADKYCSLWGSSGFWACYEMKVFQKDADQFVVWIDSEGRRFEGKVDPK